ncbi:MAG TPA: hypothetical protein VJO52_01940 [Gemmatimonadaceae bacterium]|nr:hypothetical protein [Gemmatimonadaceae bacterium]
MTLPHPYFEKSSDAPVGRRRLLVISYRFPPDTTIGSRRWEKLAHFAVTRGWSLDILTRQPAVTEGDPARMSSLPAGLRVYGVPQPRLWLKRLEDWVWRIYRDVLPRARRRNDTAQGDDGAAPAPTERPLSLDRRDIRWHPTRVRELLRLYWVLVEQAHYAAWARGAVKLGNQLVAAEEYAAVISSGPPHMSHEAGRSIAERHDLPFVMDMRDLWSLSPRLHEHVASPMWFRIAERYERRAVTRASLIVANNEPARRALMQAYPAAADHIITVLNGADDYPLPATHHDACFRIRFAGTIYITSDVATLLSAVRMVIDDLGLGPDELQVELVGPMDNPETATIAALARARHVENYVSVGPLLSHSAALDFLAGASMLVIFSGFGAVTLPAKTFEYVRFSAWILAQGESGSALDLMLQNTAADVVPPSDATATAAAIRRRIEQYRAGVRPSPVVSDDRYSRARQADILLDALDTVTHR